MSIIAVDFDGCLCEAKWPDIGAENWPVINALIQRQAEGAKLILWTCRAGKQLEEAVNWCLNRGIRFDAINENLPEMIQKYGNDCRKVYANEYWDDKNVLVANGSWGNEPWGNGHLKPATPPPPVMRRY